LEWIAREEAALFVVGTSAMPNVACAIDHDAVVEDTVNQ
jgi:hypothetical protein